MSIFQAARIIAAAMLVLALFEMPGAFYSALRLVVFVAAILEIVQIQKGSLTEGKKTGWTLAFAAIAIIFNPIIPLEMDREEWVWFNAGGAGVFGWRTFSKETICFMRKFQKIIICGFFFLCFGAALTGIAIAIYREIESRKWTAQIRVPKPEGMLSDFEAEKILEEYKRDRHSKVGKELAEKLDDWREMVRTYEFEKSDKHFKLLFENPEYREYVLRESGVSKILKSSLNPESAKKRTVISAWVSWRLGREITSQEFESERGKFAKLTDSSGYFSDEEWFEYLSKNYDGLQ